MATQQKKIFFGKPEPVALAMIFVLGLHWMQAPAYGETAAGTSQTLPPAAIESKYKVACGEANNVQVEKITAYEVDKDAIINQFHLGELTREPKHLLRMAEKSFRNFVRTACEDYLIESVFLYKNYYELWKNRLKENFLSGI